MKKQMKTGLLLLLTVFGFSATPSVGQKTAVDIAQRKIELASDILRLEQRALSESQPFQDALQRQQEAQDQYDQLLEQAQAELEEDPAYRDLLRKDARAERKIASAQAQLDEAANTRLDEDGNDLGKLKKREASKLAKQLKREKVLLGRAQRSYESVQKDTFIPVGATESERKRAEDAREKLAIKAAALSASQQAVRDLESQINDLRSQLRKFDLAEENAERAMDRAKKAKQQTEIELRKADRKWLKEIQEREDVSQANATFQSATQESNRIKKQVLAKLKEDSAEYQQLTTELADLSD